MSVVQLGSCRNLLADLEEARKRILQGRTTGFTLCLMEPGEEPAVFLGGACKTDDAAALESAMHMTMELNKQAGAHALQAARSSASSR